MEVNLYHGDCLEIMKDIPEQSVDMIMVDLPYGTTACKWDSIIPLDKLWEQYYRICKKNAAMVFTAAQPFTTMLIASNIKHFRYEWIWEKPQGTNPIHVNRMPLKAHENVLVFSQATTKYHPQMIQGKPYCGFSSDTKHIGEVYGKVKSKHRDNPDGSRFPKTVLKFPQERGLHPTQKPVTMMEYFIKTYTDEDNVVLDNTMGSGTTGVACKNLHRSFIGIEKDDKFFEIAKNRIEATNILKI
jgi:site-specific DNA-methyltransferase (adenine-specific)